MSRNEPTRSSRAPRTTMIVVALVLTLLAAACSGDPGTELAGRDEQMNGDAKPLPNGAGVPAQSSDESDDADDAVATNPGELSESATPGVLEIGEGATPGSEDDGTDDDGTDTAEPSDTTDQPSSGSFLFPNVTTTTKPATTPGPTTTAPNTTAPKTTASTTPSPTTVAPAGPGGESSTTTTPSTTAPDATPPTTTEPLPPPPAAELTPVGDCATLSTILEDRILPAPPVAALQWSGDATPTAAAENSVERNTVEAGVGESDRMVTDGRYLATITSTGRLSVMDLRGDEPRRIHDESVGHGFGELVLDGDNLWKFSSAGLNTTIVQYRLGADVQQVATHNVSGYFNSVRTIGNRGHVVTTSYVDRDSDARTSLNGVPVPCDRVVVLDGPVQSSTTVTSFNLSGGGLHASTVYSETAMSQAYATPGSLIVHGQDWNRMGSSTAIVRFTIGAGAPIPTSEGHVDGAIPGPFALSERGGVLRLALTGVGDANSVVTLAISDLEPIGSLDNIAPGESIFGVRFMGTVAHVITFERIDPLHVIDLSNPATPRQLGELEVPGFSRYLHPIGGGRLLGIGTDGGEATTVMFDVNDPTNPTEVTRVSEGPAPWQVDHRSVLWTADHGLLAFQDGNQDLRLVTVRGNELVAAGVIETPGWNDSIRPVVIGETLYVVGSQWMVPVDLDGLIAGDAIPLVANPQDDPPIVICGLDFAIV